MVSVIAHRGASAVAPENTMAAFEQALSMGADGIELDCQLSKDGHLVVIHDITLQRTTGVTGFVKDFTAAQLQKLDAGSWFGSQFKEETIPLLKDVLNLLRGRCHINIEIKNLPFRHEGIEAAVVDLLKATNIPPEEVIISSFDHICLQKLATLQPRLPIAPLFTHLPLAVEQLPGTYVHPHRGVINADFVALTRAADKKINVWTVNESDEWDYIAKHGVDGIITDHPDKLRAWLEKRRVSQ